MNDTKKELLELVKFYNSKHKELNETMRLIDEKLCQLKNEHPYSLNERDEELRHIQKAIISFYSFPTPDISYRE